MTNTKSNTDIPSVPATPLTNDKVTANRSDPSGEAKQSAERSESLPWLIRQLRGRYECGDGDVADDEKSAG